MSVTARRWFAAVGALGCALLAGGAVGRSWTVLMVAAVGLATYVGASIAGQEQRAVARSLDEADQRRRVVAATSRDVRPEKVRGLVADGARTPEEVAEVLGVYPHVARKMLDTLVAEGGIARDGEWYVPRPAVPAGAPRVGAAPRWIDPGAGA